MSDCDDPVTVIDGLLSLVVGLCLMIPLIYLTIDPGRDTKHPVSPKRYFWTIISVFLFVLGLVFLYFGAGSVAFVSQC